HPTGDTNRAASSRRAIAATLSNPVRQTMECTASAKPGSDSSIRAGIRAMRARVSSRLAGTGRVGRGAGAPFTATPARRATCLRTFERARLLEDLLTRVRLLLVL